MITKRNAKNYGIAQNRERVFMVSILGEYNYDFPQGFKLTTRLKDYLEDDVDEKYFLSDRALNGMKNTTFNSSSEGARVTDLDGVVPTLCARDYKDPKCVRIGGVFDTEDRKHQAGAVWDKENLAPTLDTMQGGWRQPSVIVRQPIKPELVGGVGEINFGKQHRQGNRIYDSEAIAMCLLAQPVGNAGGNSYLYKVDYRIRKLTPKETGRLMGMNDEQIGKQLKVVSNSQAYKQHGNGIVAQVIGLIVGMMVYEDETELREKVMLNSHTWLRHS